MDSQVLAALLGALVGGLASGLAALGGSLLVEKMKRRKTVRIRMYEELLPPLQESLANYSEAWIEDGKATLSNPRFTEGLMERIERLEHISAMAGREERRLVGHITRKVAEHQESVIESDDDKVRVAENVREISRAISELDARLRKKVD